MNMWRTLTTAPMLMLIFGCFLASTHACAQSVAGSDWPAYNRTLEGDRFAPQSNITAANVSALKPLCTYEIGQTTSFQSGPIVVGGILYVTTESDTIALDPGSCRELWRVQEKYTPANALHINRGAAWADGRLFRGTQDGRVLAYDATNGRRLWGTVIADPKLGETVPAALITWRGMVFAGNAGGDNKGVKGRMYGIDAATGRILWEQYLVPREDSDPWRGPPAPAPKGTTRTWGNSRGIPISGGATWTSYSLDTATGELYVPSGNPAPDFVTHVRPGSNIYADSVVVLDAYSGVVVRSFPLVEHDFHDWDVSAAPALLTTRQGVRAAAVAIKDGHLYALDRWTHRQLWRADTTTISNPTKPLGPTPTHFCPGTQGGTEWNGPGYSPLTNLIYVGAVDWCATVELESDALLRASPMGQPWSGSADKSAPFGKLDPPAQWAGWVSAFDADSGVLVWKRHLAAPVLGGITPTAGGVVFAGDVNGHVYGFDARNGATLWEADSGGAIGGGIISFETSSGQQLIAVAAGMTSGIWPTVSVPARLVVYGLAP